MNFTKITYEGEDEDRLIDWNAGDELIWYNVWDYERHIFGIYTIKVINNKSDKNNKEIHVFGEVISIFYESSKMYHQEIGSKTPGCWPNSFHKYSEMRMC